MPCKGDYSFFLLKIRTTEQVHNDDANEQVCGKKINLQPL